MHIPIKCSDVSRLLALPFLIISMLFWLECDPGRPLDQGRPRHLYPVLRREGILLADQLLLMVVVSGSHSGVLLLVMLMLHGPLVVMRMVNAFRGASWPLRSSLSLFGPFAGWGHPEII
jgi:hypothetical protein